MDLSHLSDDELEQLAGTGKYRPAIDPKTYVPTQADIDEAQRMTGTGKYASSGERFLAGMGKSFSDTGTAVRQGFNYVTGDQEELDQLKKQQTEDNKLFDKYGGTAGTAGNMFGAVLQSIAPGGLAANAIKGGALKQLALGGAITGTTEGVLTPLGEGDTLLGNALQGGVTGLAFGGGLAGLGYVGKGGLNAIRNIKSTNKADSVMRDYLESQTQNMTDDQLANFNSVLDNVLDTKSPVKNMTPGQAMGVPGALDAQASLITTEKATNKLKNLNAQQKKDTIDVLRSMADTIPNKDYLSSISTKDLTADFTGRIQKQANDITRPLYAKLETVPLQTNHVTVIQKNPFLYDLVKKGSTSDNLPPDLRSKLQSFLAGENPQLSAGDMQTLYRNTNNILGRLGNKDIAQKTKDGMNNLLGDIPEFGAANKAYTESMDVLNKLSSNKKLFQNNSQSIFDTSVKARGETSSLVNWLQTSAPAELKKLSAQRLINTIKSIGDDTTKGWQRKTVDQLDRIAEINNDPIINEIVVKLKTGLTVPSAKINKVVKPDNIFSFNALTELASHGAGKVPIVSSLVGKLKQEKYQEALVELMYNPHKWAVLAKQAMNKKDGLDELLQTIANSLSGTAGGVAARQ